MTKACCGIRTDVRDKGARPARRGPPAPSARRAPRFGTRDARPRKPGTLAREEWTREQNATSGVASGAITFLALQPTRALARYK